MDDIFAFQKETGVCVKSENKHNESMDSMTLYRTCSFQRSKITLTKVCHKCDYNRYLVFVKKIISKWIRTQKNFSNLTKPTEWYKMQLPCTNVLCLWFMNKCTFKNYLSLIRRTLFQSSWLNLIKKATVVSNVWYCTSSN